MPYYKVKFFAKDGQKSSLIIAINFLQNYRHNPIRHIPFVYFMIDFEMKQQLIIKFQTGDPLSGGTCI
jgi:hypothetical protein